MNFSTIGSSRTFGRVKNIAVMAAIALMMVVIALPERAMADLPDSAFAHKVAAQYSSEHAVYLSVTRKLIVAYDNGQLTAHTDENLQKLFLTNMGTQLYSREDLEYTYMNDLLSMPTGTAYIPGPKGYNRVRCSNFGAFHPADEGIFYDDDKGIAVMYSGLTPNSITETRYSQGATDINMLPSLSFYQENLPIAKCTIELTVPDYVDIGYVLVGEHTDRIKQTKETHNNQVTYRFTYNDIKPLRNIAGVPSSLYFLPHLVPYIKSYTLPSDYRKHEMLSSEDGLYKFLYKFVKNINVAHDKDLDATVEKITKGDVTPRQKAVHIYDWVQKNLHYVAFEDSLGGFYPRQAGTINERKFGDCKDMTSILVTMFRKAGIKAYYTWVGTMHLPYEIKKNPVPRFDHMICTVNIGDEWICVDGTHPTIPFGRVPDGDQGKDVMVAIDEDNFKVLSVPVAPATENTTVDSCFMHVLSGKSISGHMKVHYSGSNAYTVAYYKMLTRDEQRDKVVRMITSRGSDKYLVDKYDIDVDKFGNRDATITANYDIHDYIQKAGGQYMINMNMKRSFGDDFIETKDRTASYYLHNKSKINEVVVLELPKGGHAVHLPAAAHAELKNVFSYSISYHNAGNKVILEKNYELKTRVVTKKDFAAFNKLIDGLNRQYDEAVVVSGR